MTTARLLSGVVHEVNNALLVITGTVELLEARDDLPETAQPAAGTPPEPEPADGGSNRAGCRVYAGAGPAERIDVDLGELARIAVDLRRFAVTRAGLTIEFTPMDRPCLVLATGRSCSRPF